VADCERALKLDRSGVMVLAVGPWGLMIPMAFPGVEGVVGLGVDQENEAGFVWFGRLR
jgi:hypothetical protein